MHIQIKPSMQKIISTSLNSRSPPVKSLKTPCFECLQSVPYQPVVFNTTPLPLVYANLSAAIVAVILL